MNNLVARKLRKLLRPNQNDLGPYSPTTFTWTMSNVACAFYIFSRSDRADEEVR